MKNIIILILSILPLEVFAKPGVECAANGNCNIMGSILLIIILFVGSFVFGKIKDIFKK
ncbi:hypothetical protein [Lonepinella sp. BR2271]|uniref:hypothetical protein n=1 Tax=Lonepinella sp. BR2271 TaxID=3434550 RepID=UPI003F6DDB2E